MDNLKRIIISGKAYKVSEEEFDHYHILPNEDVVRKNEIFFKIGNTGFAKDYKKALNKAIDKLHKKLKKMCKCK